MEKNTNRSMVFDGQNIKRMAILWVIFLGFILATAIQAFAVAETKAATKIPPVDQKTVIKKAMKLQLPFIANQGQIHDSSVRYYAKTFGGTVYITDKGEMIYTFFAPVEEPKKTEGTTGSKDYRGYVLKETLVGATSLTSVGLEPAQAKVNYFIGNDKSKWKSNIPTYNSISLGEVYKGIEVSLKAYGKTVEKIFTVNPGAKPKSVRMKFQGADLLQVNANGDLEVKTSLGVVRFSKPIAYQEIGGKQKKVQVAYHMENGTYGFTIGNYDKSLPLIIDPVLSYSTHIGGTEGDGTESSVAVDILGNVYVFAQTFSDDFPMTVDAYEDVYQGGPIDTVMMKLSADGSALLYSTYLGGNERDYPKSIAVDSLGRAYVAGYTDSTNFPTQNPYQASLDLEADVFVTVLDPSLTGTAQLVYSTYLGGDRWDSCYDIAVDTSGKAYLVGSTRSTDFPLNNAFQSELSGGWFWDAFVTVLDPSLTGAAQLVYSTYIGGGGEDNGFGIAVDTSGNVYVAGLTWSADFPTANAYQPDRLGDNDAFVTKIDPDQIPAAQLVYSTYLGGTDRDHANDIAVDTSDNAYVTGIAASADFPTANAYQSNMAGGSSDAFVTKFSATGSLLDYSTYLGGHLYTDGFGNDYGASIAVDTAGRAYVTGRTNSTNFPSAHAFQDTYAGSEDAFVTRLAADGSAIDYSSYVGGSGWDTGTDIAVDLLGNVYMVGNTSSSDFPTTADVYSHGTPGSGNSDIFVVKIFATADSDGDGLTGYEEVILGTNDSLADTDGDGVNDLDDPFPTDPSESADSDSKAIRISPVGSSPYSPWIWGTKVIWKDERPGSGQHDLYLYDFSDGSGMWLTDDSGWEERPRICGNRIVWEEWDSSSGYEIYIYDLDEATPIKTKITNGSGALEFPHISGDRVVYSGPAWGDPVWTHDLTTSSEAQISPRGIWPMINGDWVVWAEQIPTNYTHLWLRCFTPTGDLCPLPEGTITDTTDFPTGIGSLPYFEISADNVVYDYSVSVSNYGINLYNRTSDTTTPLTTAQGYSPSISGNSVTWTDGYSIYMHDLLTSGTTVITTDDTSWKYYRSMFGGRVVWLDDRDGSDNVYVYTGDGVGDNSDNCPNDYNPSQADTDADGADGVGDVCDNCPNDNNPGQDDIDADGIGSACDPCPNELLSDVPSQADLNDFDNDGLCYNEEIALGTSNSDDDSDDDGVLDGDDYFPLDPDESADFDGDGIGDNGDNCPERDNGEVTYNVGDSRDECAPGAGLIDAHGNWQPDYDCDGIGDDCDNDADDDGYDSSPESDDCNDLNENNYPGCTDPAEDCPCDGQISSETPPDGNCNPNQDCDGDEVKEKDDNCPGVANPLQLDNDTDGKGDECDNCDTYVNPDQTLPIWYKDYDLDGYHNGDTVTQCERPTPITEYKSESELTSLEIDCDDNDISINPGASDVNNCDPTDDPPPITGNYYIKVELQRCNDAGCSSPTPLTYGDWDPQDGDDLRATFKAFNGDTEFSYDSDPTVMPRMNANFTLGYAVLSSGGSNPSRLRGKYLNDTSENGVANPAADYDNITFGENQVRFVCRDFGGSLTIHAEVSITKLGGDTETLTGDFTFPKDTDGDGLPDWWESPKGNLLADADPDKDGIPTSGEYRGVRWGTTVPESADFTVYDTDAWMPEATPDGLVKHFRLDPQNHRDLFVLFDGFDARFPFAVGTAFENLPSKVAVHALGTNLGGSLGQNNIDVTTVTLVNGVLGLENDNIDRWTTRSWTFSTLGKSIFGGDDYYGSYCRVFRESLAAFFDDKPHYDYTTCDGCSKNDKKVQNNWTGSSTKLESIIYVEDANDNGNPDVREDVTGNGRLDGDYPVRIDLVDPDQAYSDKGMTPPNLSADIDNDGKDEEWDNRFDLSPFDIDGNGMVELPVVSFFNEIGTLTENSEAQAAKMIITHELGHNAGITIHTSDSTCAMNDESNNLIRDNHFSQDAAALVRIHNAPYQP